MAIDSASVQPWVVMFSAAITGNILLAKFLGMCSFVAISRQVRAAWGLGVAVTFVLTGTAALNWMLYWWVLVPLHIEYLRFIMFIIMIAAFVQFVEMVVERYSPALYQTLGVFLPLITVNCAILGGTLFMVISRYNLLNAVAFGFGSGAGWLLAILAMAGIRERLTESRIPLGLRGPGIALIVTGLMALAFIGFTGVL
jgi:Na+-transporting NADH:ubiquinone oxidoreductase subunit E